MNARFGYLPHIMRTIVSGAGNSAHSLFGGRGASTAKSMLFLLGTVGITIFAMLVLMELARRRQKRIMYTQQRLDRIDKDDTGSFLAGLYRFDPVMDGSSRFKSRRG